MLSAVGVLPLPAHFSPFVVSNLGGEQDVTTSWRVDSKQYLHTQDQSPERGEKGLPHSQVQRISLG